MEVQAIAQARDADWLQDALTTHWGSHDIALCDALIDARDHSALITADRSGFLIYRAVPGSGVEILVLQALTPRRRVGTKLVHTLQSRMAGTGAAFMSATTTNDNLPALGFNQKLGFRLHTFRSGAVDRARQTIKPQIPRTGYDALPIHDEIELRCALIQP